MTNIALMYATVFAPVLILSVIILASHMKTRYATVLLMPSPEMQRHVFGDRKVTHRIRFNPARPYRKIDGVWEARSALGWRKMTYDIKYDERTKELVIHVSLSRKCDKYYWTSNGLIDKLRDIKPDQRATTEQTQNIPKKNKQHKHNGTMKNSIRLIVTCGTVIILIKVMIVLIRYLPTLLESYLNK